MAKDKETLGQEFGVESAECRVTSCDTVNECTTTIVIRSCTQKESDIDINTKDIVGSKSLMVAVLTNQAQLVETLLERGDDVNTRGGVMSKTSLIFAAERGYKDIVKIFLGAGADVNLQSFTNRTALMYAAENGYKDIVEILLNSGANVNTQNDYKKTSLMYAATKGHKEIVEILIKAGADVNTQCYYNQEAPCDNTALMYAASEGHIEIINMLLDAGADHHITRGRDGKTALDIAKKKLGESQEENKAKYQEIIELLKSLPTPGCNIKGGDDDGGYLGVSPDQQHPTPPTEEQPVQPAGQESPDSGDVDGV